MKQTLIRWFAATAATLPLVAGVTVTSAPPARGETAGQPLLDTS